MKGNSNNIPDFNDILFESRNREYGAYQLRKSYNSVIIAGIFVASFIVSSAVIIPFLARPSDERIVTGGRRYVQVRMQNLEPPKNDIYVPPAPPPPRAAVQQEIVKYVAPEIVDTVFEIDRTQASTDEILAQSDNKNVEPGRSGSGDDLLTTDSGLGTDDPFFIVEVMPSFKGGGIEKFREWVNKRTNYPQEAINAKIKGTVFVTFIVEKDGSVSNVTILKGVNPLLDNEAIKAISESPKWSPGLQRGQPVRVRYQIPLSFIL
jgi:protein TonB